MAGELQDVIGGEVIAAAFTNAVKDRTVMRYANDIARSAAIPAPVPGDMSWLEDTLSVEVFDGADWVRVSLPDTITGTLPLAVDAFNSNLQVIPHNLKTVVALDTLRYTSGDLLLGTSRFTVPLDGSGMYMFGTGCTFDGLSVYAEVGVEHVTGAIYATSSSPSVAGAPFESWAARFLNVGEWIQPVVKQQSGGDLDLIGDLSRFWVARIA